MITEQWRNETDWQESSTTFYNTNFTWNGLEKNPSIHCKNPASNSLSHETAFQIHGTWLIGAHWTATFGGMEKKTLSKLVGTL